MKKTAFVIFLLILVSLTTFAAFLYEIDWQKEVLEIGSSGEILLSKSFSFRVLPQSTENGTEIWVGLPTKGTKVHSANYIQGGRITPLEYRQRSSSDNYQVIFDKIPTILPGENLEINFSATIPDLIHWLDKKQLDEEPNSQKVSLSYIPAWWEKGVVRDLTVEFRFEPGLELNRVQYAKVEPHSIDIGQRAQVSFRYEYANVPQDTKLHHALILPRDYFVASFEPQKDWLSTSQVITIASVIGFVVILFVLLISYLVKQERYMTPAAYITGKEAYTSFDPVETALFFSVPGEILVKLIIMGLMDKNIIKMTSSGQLKRESTLEKLSWYEELFLDSVDEDLNIKPDKWKDFCTDSFSKLKEMLGGYCGAQTKAYYQKKLTELYDEEGTDPRWLILKDYLDKKINEKQTGRMPYQPAYLHPYMPIFYLNLINSNMENERKATFNNTFVSRTGSGHSGGSSCACACACACASSGGCT